MQAKLKNSRLRKLVLVDVEWDDVVFVHWAFLYDVRTDELWVVNFELVPLALRTAYGKIDRSLLKGEHRIWVPRPKYFGSGDLIEMEKNAVAMWKRKELPLEWVATGTQFGTLVVPTLEGITPIILAVHLPGHEP